MEKKIKLMRLNEFINSDNTEVMPDVKPDTKPAEPIRKPSKPAPFQPVVPSTKPLPKLAKATADDVIDKFLKSFSKERIKTIIK